MRRTRIVVALVCLALLFSVAAMIQSATYHQRHVAPPMTPTPTSDFGLLRR